MQPPAKPPKAFPTPRLRPPVNSVPAPHLMKISAPRRRLELRHSGGRRSSDKPHRHRRRALRHYSYAKSFCVGCRNRQAFVEVRLRNPWHPAGSWARLLDRRQGQAHSGRRNELRLRPGRCHRHFNSGFRKRRPDRPPRKSGPRAHRFKICRPDQPGNRLQRPRDIRWPQPRNPACASRRHSRLRRSNRQAALVVSHHSASR